MGSGKSSLGKRLASRLGIRFIDADNAIEDQEGKSIQRIFEEDGESHFRALESDWLKKLNEDNVLIALGGGTPCFNDNLKLIHEKGISIYVNVRTPIIVSRLMQSKNVRPLIKEVIHDQKALTDMVSKMLSEREEYYKQATLEIEGSDVKAEDIDKWVEEIRRYLP